MTSPLPPAGGYAPVNSLEAARLGVAMRGNRIATVLSGLMILQLFFAVLILGGAAVGWAFLGSALGQEIPGLGKVPQLSTVLGFGVGYLVFIVAALAIYVFSILAAQRAIRSVQRYAADPEHQTRPEVRGFTGWLTFWQWYMLVGSLLGVVIGMVLVYFTSLLDTSSKLDSGSQAGVLAFTVIGSLIQLVPTVVLTWLILNAIKRFFLSVEAHSGGVRTPVSPVAKTVGSWLIFVIVTLALLVAFIVFYAILLGVLAAIPGLAGPSGGSAARSRFDASLPALFIALGVFTLILAAVYGLMIAVVAWSRGFALDTATLLDGGSSGRLPGGGNFSPGGAMNIGVDAWRGAVAPPEPPR